MTGPSNELPDKDLINEGYSQNPYPAWLWLFLLAIVILLFSSLASWYSKEIAGKKNSDPFLQVTNRQMSLFLWQNPSFMRVSSPTKNTYLTAFNYQESANAIPEQAEDYVAAPPEIIFNYHVWQRLVADYLPSRPIPLEEFRQFLDYDPQWLPKYWKKAPPGYIKFIVNLPKANFKDISTLPNEILPFEVRQAFQGWKNFTKEGNAINAVSPTYVEMEEFLKSFPNYARNYWRNIVKKEVPDYLKSIKPNGNTENNPIPPNELSIFLKAAFYNWQQSQASK